MAKSKYTIEDIEIGDLISFKRKLSEHIRENYEVLGKLDKHLLIVKIPQVKTNAIVDIYEVTEIKHSTK